MKVKIKPCQKELLISYYDDCAKFGIFNNTVSFVEKLLRGPVDVDYISQYDTIVFNGSGVCNKRFVNIVKERTENA